jgi:hypothetical protein
MWFSVGISLAILLWIFTAKPPFTKDARRAGILIL